MKLINKILCASLVAMPLLANAGDLKIANNTKYDLSFKINNVCSDKSEGFGVIPANTNKVISEKGFNKECEYNPKWCVTTVYSKPDCKGKAIAGVGFDTSYGVSYVSGSTSEPAVSVTGSGFNLIFTSPIK